MPDKINNQQFRDRQFTLNPFMLLYSSYKQKKYMRSLICVIFFLTEILSCCKCKPSVVPEELTTFVKGADVSWVTEMESSGITFYTGSGEQMECMALMKNLGMNTIRLRAWVNPETAWNSTADVVAKAVRAKSLGLRVMIDLHYSDTWADPGAQTKPAAWADADFAALKDSVSVYTANVLTQVKNAGVTPEWVQVGNETSNGMLWPDGKASENMAGFAQLVNAGYDAVKEIFPGAKVIVHTSGGADNNLSRWVFDGLTTNGARFDVIGLSMYPSFSGWAAYNEQCLANMNDLVFRYNKSVMIVEAGMPWDSPDECWSFLTDLIEKTKSVSGGKGLGVMYWEPQSHNNWKGYTLGAFDNSGKPTHAMDAFK